MVLLSMKKYSAVQVMRMWRGSETTDDDVDRQGMKPGPPPKLSLIDQFFVVMVSYLVLISSANGVKTFEHELLSSPFFFLCQ